MEVSYDDMPSLEEDSDDTGQAFVNSGIVINFVDFLRQYWPIRQFTRQFILKVYHWYRKVCAINNRTRFIVRQLLKTCKVLYYRPQSGTTVWKIMFRSKALPLVYLYLKVSANLDWFDSDYDDFETKFADDLDAYRADATNFENYYDAEFDQLDLQDNQAGVYESTYYDMDSDSYDSLDDTDSDYSIDGADYEVH